MKLLIYFVALCLIISNVSAVIVVGNVDGVDSIVVNEKNIGNPMLPYDYMVYKEGGVTYALNCTTGYCDYAGTDNEVMNNVTNGGHVYVYVKRGITWTTTAIPAWTRLEGIDGTQFIIQAPNPLTDYITIGSNVRLRELSIWDATGDQGGTCRYVNEYVNLMPAETCYAGYNGTWGIDIGSEGTDTPGMAVNMYSGIGDNFWAGVGDGTGYRAHVSQLDNSKTGYGFHVQNFGAGYGFYGIQKNTATAPLIKLVSEDTNTQVLNMDTGNTVYTSNMQDMVASGITTGNFVNMFSNTPTTFSGNGIQMNFGYGAGDFTGNFLDLRKDGVSQFLVEDDGNVYCKGFTFDLGGDYMWFDDVNNKYMFFIDGTQVAYIDTTGFHNGA